MIDKSAISEIEVRPLETSNQAKKFLVCYRERHFEVSESVAQLIDICKRSESVEAIAADFSKWKGKTYSTEQIEHISREYLAPLFLVKQTKAPSPLLVHMDLIPASAIDKISEFCKFLFKPAVCFILVGAILALDGFFLFQTDSYVNFDQIGLLTIAGIVLLYISSSLFHELGHATACRYFNISHGNIGFGLYLNFPVFYTDVSNIWQLPRKQRLIVNMAGAYFQLLYLIPFFIAYFLTYNDIIRYFIYAVNLNFLVTLNPFFKFDGYWIVSDLLGVPNLRKRTREFFVYVFRKLRGKEVKEIPFLLTMKRKEKIFLIFYSVVVNIFFLCFFCYFLPKMLIHVIDTLPGLFAQLIRHLAYGSLPPFDLLQTTFSQLIFGFLTGFMLYQALRPVIRMIKHKLAAHKS